MRDKLNRFMMGRYGADSLAKFLLGLMIALMVLNLFLRISLINTLVFIILIYLYFRMFSRNISARYNENMKFLQMKNRVLGFFNKEKRMAQDLKTHHIYKCPNCKQKIRIPRGKGRICITCPKCKTEFVKKS